MHAAASMAAGTQVEIGAASEVFILGSISYDYTSRHPFHPCHRYPGSTLGPGGIRSVVAESVLVKHQLLILNRSRQRAPNLRVSDRFVAGLCALFMRPTRLIRSTIVLKPSTLLYLHQALEKRKYHTLFSPKHKGKSGPKGPSRELIDAMVAAKLRNPSWGRPRIAKQAALAFGVSIDKDMVRHTA